MIRILFLSIFFIGSFPLIAQIENSILPLMEQLQITDLSGKVGNALQNAQTQAIAQRADALRIVSFNMLFNLPWAEEQLEPDNQWSKRKSRLLEYLKWTHADIICSQELQNDQLAIIAEALKDQYCYYGVETKNDIPAIFYRKDRLELIQGETFYFSDKLRNNPFAVCYFRDLMTGQVFQVINTHLAFSSVERRQAEAAYLSNYLLKQSPHMPLIVTGDFNTFPFRQELRLPFYDGDFVIALIETGGVKDSINQALFGHFGPISSTNYNSSTQQAFGALGTPGVILDHIFVNDHIKVVSHGIDPAQVNGFWPSDHFPVIIDCLICDI